MQKKILFFVIIHFFIYSCNSQKFEVKETKIKVINKIILSTEEYYPNVSTRAYGIIANYQKEYFDLVAPNLNAFLRYDTSGKNVLVFSKNLSKEEHLLPVGMPAAFEWIADTLLLLYPTNNTIYKIKNNQITEKITLQLPSGFVITRGTPLYYYPESQNFIISIGIDAETTQIFFEKSYPFALFDKKGKLVKNFGNYPKKYAQGKSISEGLVYLKSIREQESIFCLFPHFDAIFEFDKFGKELRIVPIPPAIYRDTILRISPKKLEDMNKKEVLQYQNDTYRGGLAKVKNKNIFFTLYFSHKLGREVLRKLDFKSNIFQDAIIPLELASNHLFPIATTEQTCFLLSVNPQSDDIYIYEVQMD